MYEQFSSRYCASSGTLYIVNRAKIAYFYPSRYGVCTSMNIVFSRSYLTRIDFDFHSHVRLVRHELQLFSRHSLNSKKGLKLTL